MNSRPGRIFPERYRFDRVAVDRVSARGYLTTDFIPEKCKIIESFRLQKEL